MGSGGISIWQLSIIVLYILILVTPFWQIFKKAGYSSWLSLLMLVCVGSEINRTRRAWFCVSPHHEAQAVPSTVDTGMCAPSIMSCSFSLAARAQPCHFGSCTAWPWT